jgi:hypothetical protein
MTRIKDKLTHSVQQAKNAESPGPGTRRLKQRKSASREALAQGAHPAPAKDETGQAEPASSTEVLFPQRVWPD